MMSPSKDVLRLLSLWQAGQLKLEELLTRTYPLEQINDGYADMHAGRNIRGLITFDTAKPELDLFQTEIRSINMGEAAAIRPSG
jgi:hypothetical protein